MGRKPGINYFAIGQQMSARLEGVCGYEAIAAELGVSVQRSHQVAMIALGKLVHGLSTRLGVEDIQNVAMERVSKWSLEQR